MLNFLSLVVVTDLHFLASHAFVFFFKAFLFISECFKRHHNLFNFVLALLQHFFLLFVLRVESFALTTSVLLVTPRIFDLAIFNLD